MCEGERVFLVALEQSGGHGDSRNEGGNDGGRAVDLPAYQMKSQIKLHMLQNKVEKRVHARV